MPGIAGGVCAQAVPAAVVTQRNAAQKNKDQKVRIVAKA
jgi:hypothetical protein